MLVPSDPTPVVLRYYATAEAYDDGAIRDCLGDGYVLEIVGQGNWPLGGEYSGASLGNLIRHVKYRFPKGIATTVNSITAQGDRVVVESILVGTRCDGTRHIIEGAAVFSVRDGLIQRQRIFCDIVAAEKALCEFIAV